MSGAELERLASVALAAVWRASWQAAVLAALVLLVQWTLRKQMSARWRHNLWLLVLLRLAIPITPPSPVSLFNLTRHLPETPAAIPIAPRVDVAGEAIATPTAAAAMKQISWTMVLACAWAAGAILLLARIAWASVRLSRAVRRMTPVDDPKVLARLRRCADEIGVRTIPRILSSPQLAAPALMGCLRPRLLLPHHVLSAFDEAELRLIALHELAHLKRRDVAINWLVAVLQALHWFNPAVWLAFARLRVDRELAADELVLSATNPTDRNHYGQTIVKLLESFRQQPAARAALAGTVGILERPHPLRRRITMIAQFHSRAKGWTALAATCMLLLAALALTDAVHGDDAPAAAPATSTAATTAREASLFSPATSAAIERAKNSAAAKDIEEAKKDLAKEIRAQNLVMSVQGMPINADAVNAQIAAATQHLEQEIHVTTAPKVAPSDAEAAYALLQRRLPDVQLDNAAFSDVVDFLRDVSSANISVNYNALESVGIDRGTTVTLRLRDVRFEQVLRQLLRQAGAGGAELAFGIDDGTIIISTLEDIEPRVRAYDVSDLAATATSRPADEHQLSGVEQIKEVVLENVAPDSWREKGGTIGNISVLGSKLVISTTDMNHLDIDRLLAELRRAN